MIIYDWAVRHNIPYAAMQELLHIMGAAASNAISEALPREDDAQFNSEERVQIEVRLEASQNGEHLYRNNVGALQDKNDRLVRYGLCNDTKKLNEVVKSGDLIGWKKILIEPHHVGKTIAQFKSRECKPRGWVYTGTAREEAQLNWINLVNACGGDASFENGSRTKIIPKK
jgi:hypothetical protein